MMSTSSQRPGAEPVRRPIQRQILYKLVPLVDEPALWTVDDLAEQLETREIGDPLDELISAGLVSQTPEGGVFASPAAVYVIETIGHVG